MEKIQIRKSIKRDIENQKNHLKNYICLYKFHLNLGIYTSKFGDDNHEILVFLDPIYKR